MVLNVTLEAVHFGALFRVSDNTVQLTVWIRPHWPNFSHLKNSIYTHTHIHCQINTVNTRVDEAMNSILVHYYKSKKKKVILQIKKINNTINGTVNE